MRVAILGATGKTGQAIVDGLLESTTTKFELTALTRPSSVDKPETQALKARGVKIVPVDLTPSASLSARHNKASTEPAHVDRELVKILTGIDVVISATFFLNLAEQIPLIDAAKVAGVGRFVPCNFQTVAPRGVMALADAKYEVLDHIQRIRQPYTIIEVGWWYQIALPRLPSGRFDNNKHIVYTAAELVVADAGEGEGGKASSSSNYLPSALTDLRDVGRFVARIVADGERTLNKCVFAYGEVLTHKQLWDTVERLSGEKLERNEVTPQMLEERIAQVPADQQGKVGLPLAVHEYQRSWGVRGDNTPENARFLGFLTTRELYPDFQVTTHEEFVKDALAAAE
ncbi:uncharacterized protein B0I36DRAFT_393121 [Microdochium trichocladiopsis]|uniref:NmrA-like domain-containing protein n=1 Tax=Microdochium trichocladiopsis TaxID=1682393 RepID=A0A9P8XYK3_9PEZI|nr:uncharacterized protein B0I36DRAFT_393121 [Microdochium trichocladiopsis]KAH7020889.1 hypothetical protein B0I36DRAFT_393121 [Microdochium trichocladiopsis]